MAVTFQNRRTTRPPSLHRKTLVVHVATLLGAAHEHHLTRPLVGPTVGTRLIPVLHPVPPTCRAVTLTPPEVPLAFSMHRAPLIYRQLSASGYNFVCYSYFAATASLHMYISRSVMAF